MATKKITKWEQAFKNQGIDPTKMPDVSMLPAEFQKPQEALYKLHVVAKELNGDWVADYTDQNQKKYYPWFEVKATNKNKSVVGLSYIGFAYWHSYTGVGVRLCYKDAETARYAAEKFKKLYEDLYLHR